MSASLVGSEMCIRDRPPFSQGHPEPWAKMLSRSNIGHYEAAPSLCQSACLLYTSDAADDM
eukprot:12513736-Alexandrium_andersonii.AAC.1